MNRHAEPPKEKFPLTFYYANAIELFERLAFYGMYIGLSLYLTNVVGIGDKDTGTLLGNFRMLGSLAPIVCGAVADRITFRRALIIAFSLYVLGYFGMFASPSPALAKVSLVFVAIAGGFMKPVITGTVVRTAPEGRQAEGFAIFYRMINAGSVIGKSMAFAVRAFVSLRFVMITSVVASAIALALAKFGYTEPERGIANSASSSTTAQSAKATSSLRPTSRHPAVETLAGYVNALSNWRFTTFLLVFSGFYFMSEQFYMTFPKYVTRHIDDKAPLEIITLVNHALIALFQGKVSRITSRFHPLTTMIFGILIASFSMLVMGAIPTLWGACLSGGLYALAEMAFSPRFYDYIASFAPPGKAGLYMGLAFVPFAIGAWFGGQVSGRLISQYLPIGGAHDTFRIWSTYAVIGLACAIGMMIYRYFARTPSASLNAD